MMQALRKCDLLNKLEPTVCNSLFSRQTCLGGFVYRIFSNAERRLKAITILARHLQCRHSQDRLFRKNIYRLEWTEALVKAIHWTFWQLLIIRLSLFELRLATVLFFMSIIKMIIVCRKLRAVKKVHVGRVCGSKNSKMFSSCKKASRLDSSGKQSN